MFEITKPSYQHRVQTFDDMLYAIPTGALGLGSDAIPQRFHAFLADPAFPGFESITQKLEALTRYRTISYMRLVRMKASDRFPKPRPVSRQVPIGPPSAFGHITTKSSA